MGRSQQIIADEDSINLKDFPPLKMIGCSIALHLSASKETPFFGVLKIMNDELMISSGINP